MSQTALRRLTGLLFIAGAVLVNIPYTLLILNFDYPDILRQPAAEILTRFAAGGSGLIAQWLAFAWIGLPLLFGMLLLPKATGQDDSPLIRAATTAGVVAGLAQMVGLLRWVFVVPVLAQRYTDPAASDAARQSLEIAFQVVHQFGGVLLGEHVGQFFTIVWMGLISVAVLRARLFGAWLGWFGIAASLVYLTAQTELFASVIPGFPVLPEAGLVGSLLWLGWMIALGIALINPSVIPLSVGQPSLEVEKRW